MQGTSLAGHSILIVEDEPLIALDMRFAFEKAGASVVLVYPLPDAAHHVEQDGLSGAVLDYGLGSQDGDALCHHLRQRNIPFILHSMRTYQQCLSRRNCHSKAGQARGSDRGLAAGSMPTEVKRNEMRAKVHDRQ